MTQRQMIEMVKVHHPTMSETEIRIRLNNAMKDFCVKTKIIKGAFNFNTEVGQRYYGLNDKIIEVNSVDYDGKQIKRLVGRPETRDIT